MKRIAVASVIGGIVLFAWGMVSWMVIPWHQLQKLGGEQDVRDALRGTGAARGVYVVPGLDHGVELTPEAEAAWESAHEQGPLAMIVFDPQGGAPMPVSMMISGLVIDIIVALAAAVLLSLAAPALPKLVSRVLFVVLLGVFSTVGTDLPNWNWMHYPLRFTVEMALDRIAASVLLGIVLAVIVKPTVFVDPMHYEVPAG